MRYATEIGRRDAQQASGHDRGEPTSERVPRNTLSRDRIVDAALALLDAEGFEAVTMPSLAKRLGVGTMSLYRHVADKDDLINAVAERVLSGVAVPDGDPDDWEGRVVGYLRALRDAAIAHPALSRILAERGLTVGPVFEQLEAVHAILRAAGFSDLGRRPNLLHAAQLRVRLHCLGAAPRSPTARRGLHSSLERRPRSPRPLRLPKPPRPSSTTHHRRVAGAVRVRTRHLVRSLRAPGLIGAAWLWWRGWVRAASG